MGDGKRPPMAVSLPETSKHGRCGVSVTGSSASPPAVTFSLSAFGTARSAILVTRPLPVFAAADTSKDAPSRTRRLVCRRPRGLPHRALRHVPEGSRRCALGVTPASGYGHRASRMSSCFHDARVHTGLPGFRPLRRSQMVASTNMPAATFASAARVCLTRYGPSSGPLTLLTVFSATTPAGLFHPARALGVSPFRAFSRRAGTPFGARCPPDVSSIDPPRCPLRRPTAPDHGPIQRFQRAQHRKPTHVAFRALLPPEVRNIVEVV